MPPPLRCTCEGAWPLPRPPESGAEGSPEFWPFSPFLTSAGPHPQRVPCPTASIWKSPCNCPVSRHNQRFLQLLPPPADSVPELTSELFFREPSRKGLDLIATFSLTPGHPWVLWHICLLGSHAPTSPWLLLLPSEMPLLPTPGPVRPGPSVPLLCSGGRTPVPPVLCPSSAAAGADTELSPDFVSRLPQASPYPLCILDPDPCVPTDTPLFLLDTLC